jgi:ribose transport system ATP-binding protein
MNEDGSILAIDGVSKSFFGIRALHEVSVAVHPGEILCVIGENGAGKSTLMNIMGGNVRQDGGRMELEGRPYAPDSPLDATRAGIAFIHQELNLFPNLSVEENVFISAYPRTKGIPLLNRRVMRRRAQELLDSIRLGVSPNTPVEKLSPGEKQLVEIAKALSTDPRIIIFDEPTTSLSAREAEHLFGIVRQLKAEGRTVIYISHILEDVIALHDRILVLRDGEMTGLLGKDEFTKDTLIRLMVGRDLGEMYPQGKAHPTDEVALEVRNLSQPWVVRNISFCVRQREIVGLFGLMGSGRTELARMLFGVEPFAEGEIVLGGVRVLRVSPVRSIENRVAFVTEDRRSEGLIMDQSILRNVSLAALPRYAVGPFGSIRGRQLETDVQKTVNALRVKCGPIQKSLAKSLSGGNQQKAVLAKWLMTSPRVFIMDEPTRGIDVGAKHDVYSLICSLAAENSGILFISSEIEELMGICDRILVMSRGEVYRDFSRAQFVKEDIMKAAFRQQEENGDSGVGIQ